MKALAINIFVALLTILIMVAASFLFTDSKDCEKPFNQIKNPSRGLYFRCWLEGIK